MSHATFGKRNLSSLEYTSAEFRVLCAAHGVLQSMGRTRARARTATVHWLEAISNRRRRRSAIDMLSPVDDEQRYWDRRAAASRGCLPGRRKTKLVVRIVEEFPLPPVELHARPRAARMGVRQSAERPHERDHLLLLLEEDAFFACSVSFILSLMPAVADGPGIGTGGWLAVGWGR